MILMKKIIGFLISLIVFISPAGALGADEAVFSVTSSKTQYSVGDDITVSFSVDAGPYASTLNVIDMDIAIDDSSVIEPTNASSAFTAGSVYSSIALQSYSNGLAQVVVYVNPENKPSSRSGLIGTMTFKALKEGRATISYDRIEAAEENNITEFVNTSASSLTIEVGSGVSSSSTSSTSSTVSTSGTTGTSAGVGTSTLGAASSLSPTTTTSATTGPEHMALAVILFGLVSYLGFIWYKNNKYYPKV